MLILLDDDQRVVARSETAADRIIARVRATTLDRDLANGVPPETSSRLALRAQALVRPATRHALAECVEHLIQTARQGHSSRCVSARIPTRSADILAAADVLETLASALRTQAPVPARGVAQVRVLLTDGGGPLYSPGQLNLRQQVLNTIRELDPLGQDWN